MEAAAIMEAIVIVVNFEQIIIVEVATVVEVAIISINSEKQSPNKMWKLLTLE